MQPEHVEDQELPGSIAELSDDQVRMALQNIHEAGRLARYWAKLIGALQNGSDQ
ncbi:MAG: hypothetical protein AAB489_02290 [Patescibacteria group bacterium]